MFRFSLVLLAVLFVTRPALAEQSRIRTGHLSYTVQSSRVAIASELAAIGETTLGEVARQLGVGNADNTPDIFAPITVRIAHTEDEFVEAMPNQQNIEWAAGVAFPAHGIIVLRINAQTRFTVSDVFRHELSHIVLARATRGADLPLWFIEGVAVHQAGEQVRERWQKAADATLTESLPAMVTLAEGFPSDGVTTDFAYAQSTAFVGYLLQKAGWAGIRMVVAHVRDGKSFAAAVEASYGSSVAELEAGFREQVAKSASWLPIILGSGVLTAAAGIVFIVLGYRKRKRTTARLHSRQDPLDDEFA